MNDCGVNNPGLKASHFLLKAKRDPFFAAAKKRGACVAKGGAAAQSRPFAPKRELKAAPRCSPTICTVFD